MKIAHTADWHLAAMGNRLDEEGNNSRLMDLARCAQATVKGAVERDCDLILHGGDWTHTWRPTPTVVDCVRQALNPAMAAGVPVIGVEGNHDVPRSAVDLAGPSLFRGMPGVRILARPTIMQVGPGPEGMLVAEQGRPTPDGKIPPTV
ncbi:MAG TPA: metallophosphoesterase, partial [Polyangia bacterium]|nr:metallophosphoesterase [Polyangia bacterium]